LNDPSRTSRRNSASRPTTDHKQVSTPHGLPSAGALENSMLNGKSTSKPAHLQIVRYWLPRETSEDEVFTSDDSVDEVFDDDLYLDELEAL